MSSGICSNRPDQGIGLHKKVLTTCTTDVFLVPLAPLVAILMFLVCFAIRKRHPGEREENVPLQDYTSKNTSAVNREAIHSYRAAREKRQSKAGFRFGLAVLCGMFLLAAFGIEVYEMIRLDQAKLGIGLLPIVPIGITIVLVPLFVPTHGTNKYSRIARPHFFPWALTCLVFGVLSCVLVGVRLNSLIKLGEVENMNKNSAKSKHFIENGTRKLISVLLCAMYGAFSIVYSVLWFHDAQA